MFRSHAAATETKVVERKPRKALKLKTHFVWPLQTSAQEFEGATLIAEALSTKRTFIRDARHCPGAGAAPIVVNIQVG